jgi:hemerythrin
MPDFFPWDADVYSVGVAIIDEQHKNLFHLINELANAMKVGKGSSVVKKILNDLIEYTKTHFSAEEGYMEKCNYPELPGHKKIHIKLTEDVIAMQKKLLENPNINISIETLEFLKNWLTQHIKEVDKKYTPYMKDMK